METLYIDHWWGHVAVYINAGTQDEPDFLGAWDSESGIDGEALDLALEPDRNDEVDPTDWPVGRYLFDGVKLTRIGDLPGEFPKKKNNHP